MPVPTAWRLISSGGVDVRHWDDEFVVYNPLSGNTHYLDDVTGSVLASISNGRGTEAQLCDLVESMVEYPDDSSRLDNLRYMLIVLLTLGLIEPDWAC